VIFNDSFENKKGYFMDYPKIYHIVHIDKLQSIINSGYLLSDSEIIKRSLGGTTIGMSRIKKRRLYELTLPSYPDLHVGECVPFYFCPRSVMLYIIYKGNHSDIEYKGGQDNIIHLEADLFESIKWAEKTGRRWVITYSNAGSYYFNDSNKIEDINNLDWDAINSYYWTKPQVREAKQSEFLCEERFDWRLIKRIGVNTEDIFYQVEHILQSSCHKPILEIKNNWYY